MSNPVNITGSSVSENTDYRWDQSEVISTFEEIRKTNERYLKLADELESTFRNYVNDDAQTGNVADSTIVV